MADNVDAFRREEERIWAARASGKMANALGHALPGESQEELDRIAAEDQRLAQKGMVKLKIGETVSYKHIDELTREDRTARIAAEREEVAWLKKRFGLPKD
jgi:predicted 3-demethylubiquinone-9 3-methyltransferase (glyoxalase superfamily)